MRHHKRQRAGLVSGPLLLPLMFSILALLCIALQYSALFAILSNICPSVCNISRMFNICNICTMLAMFATFMILTIFLNAPQYLKSSQQLPPRSTLDRRSLSSAVGRGRRAAPLPPRHNPAIHIARAAVKGPRYTLWPACTMGSNWAKWLRHLPQRASFLEAKGVSQLCALSRCLPEYLLRPAPEFW